MAASPSQVFSNVTPEQYATLLKKGSAAGFNFTGNSGTASQYGVEVSWNYSPETRELSIQCLSTPFFISADTVNAKIAAVVKESLG